MAGECDVGVEVMESVGWFWEVWMNQWERKDVLDEAGGGKMRMKQGGGRRCG